MAENRNLESVFLWGLTAALAFLALLHWAAYFIGPQIWVTSWPAIPLTLAALFAGAGALMMRRKAHRVRMLER